MKLSGLFAIWRSSPNQDSGDLGWKTHSRLRACQAIWDMRYFIFANFDGKGFKMLSSFWIFKCFTSPAWHVIPDISSFCVRWTWFSFSASAYANELDPKSTCSNQQMCLSKIVYVKPDTVFHLTKKIINQTRMNWNHESPQDNLDHSWVELSKIQLATTCG